MSDSPKTHLTQQQIDAILKEKLDRLKKRSKLLDLILSQELPAGKTYLDLYEELIGDLPDGTTASNSTPETTK